MSEEKSYKASTGVDEFYYAVLTNEDEQSFKTGEITRVKFLQEIEVEMPQEAMRAYGDNRTAEIAISGGNITVTTQFHKVPVQDKNILFGLETVDGLSSVGSDDVPPYVAAVFTKTFEDGSKEWVGLTKGMFMRSKITGKTKEENKEFDNEEVTGEFMERYVEGALSEKSVLFGADKKGETDNRDSLFQKIFGKSYPGTTDGEQSGVNV
ncbi:phage tail protein [Peribacillus frigoritolerans]|uniref:major tail protein n=1 Tax=Peribacillus frigoritolerans TaxID=450367 RepID=UPI002E21111A|nr:major tail protein [Peribacillus frigoritolerans]MED3710034.1 phage tail protein [Peribacillus frigoritolerans]